MIPILFIDTNHGFGGDTVALLNMIEALARRGVACAVACIDGGSLHQRLAKHPEVRVLPLPLPIRATVSRGEFLRRMARSILSVQSFSLRHGVRLAHLNTNVAGSGQFIACIARVLSLGRIRVVYHAHCSPKNDPLTRLTLALSSRVWAVSEYTAGQHRRAGIETSRLRVLPNLVRQPQASKAPVDWRQKLRLDPESILISVVGRLSPNKGQHIAIDAVAQLPHQLNWHLLLAGDDRVPDGNSGFRGQLLEQAHKLGIASHVHLVGHVADPSAIYDQSDVVLVPSDDEAFCLSAAEAIAARANVIAADRSALREVVGRTAGLPVVDRTPEAFASAILRMLRGGGMHAERAPLSHAERLLSTYGIHAFEQRYFELLSEILGNCCGIAIQSKEAVHV